MTIIRGIMAIIGAIVAVIVGCVWFLKTEQRRIEKDAAKGILYDERQVAAHGKAAAFAASVGAGYLLIMYGYIGVFEFEGNLPVNASTLLLGGFWLVMVSYHLGCLMTDSVIPLGGYRFPAVLYTVLAVVLIAEEFVFGLAAEALWDRENTLRWDRLVMGFGFLSIGIIHLIARARDKRNQE